MMRCLACHAEVTPGKRFCGDCGAAYPENFVEGAAARTVPLKDERRVVTVVFADLSGFTALSETRDPEAVTALMNRCFAALTACVEAQDGFVDKFMGDCVMALFGAPSAHDDDPMRAVDCARAMQSALAEVREREGLDLGLSIGINTGRVLAGRVGAGSRAAFTVMGDAVNVTQRLQSKAARGEILVSHATARQLGGRYELVALPPLHVKNRTEPVVAYRLGTATTASVDRLGPFYGRALELGALDAAVAAARAGNGRCVVLSGASGMGKSRIEHELRRRLRPDDGGRRPLVLTGRSPNAFGPIPYRPWREMMRELFDLSEEMSPEAVRAALEDRTERALDREVLWYLADLLGAPYPDTPLAELAPESRAANLHLMLQRAIGWAAGKHPLVVLVFDDAQWADEGTGNAISSFLVHLEEMSVVLVMLKHEETPPSLEIPERPFVQRIALAPWRQDEVEAYLSLRGVDAEGLVAAAARLHERTGGQPAYIELILRDWLDQGLWREGDPAPASAALPEALESAYLARLDRLPSVAREVGVTAALLGRSFRRRHLDGVLDADSASALAVLVAADILQEDRPPPEAAYTFRGEGLRETAAGVSTRQRAQEILGRLATVLESDRDPEPSGIASAWIAAAQPSRAMRWLLAAGEQAFAASRYGEADLHLRAILGDAMTAHATDEDRRRAALTLAHALQILARWDECLSVCDIAVQALPGPCPAAHARRCCALSLLGRNEEAVRAGERALTEARDLGDPMAEALAAHSLGVARWQGADNEGAEALLEDSLRIHRTLGDHAGEAQSLTGLGSVAIARGQPERARDLYQQAIDLRRSLGDRLGLAHAMSNLGATYYFLGDYGRAEQFLEESLEQRRALGDRFGEGTSLGNLGELVLERGEFERGMARLRAAQAIYDELKSQSPAYLTIIAEASRRQGHLDDADRAMTRARALLPTARTDQIGRIHLYSGHLARDRGDLAGARAAYETCRGFAAAERITELADDVAAAIDALDRGEPIPRKVRF